MPKDDEPLSSERVKVSAPTLSGRVQRYFTDIQMGTIQGSDMQFYAFKRSNWLSPVEPKAGLNVRFELESNKAVRILTEE